jgi:hypothetical protein
VRPRDTDTDTDTDTTRARGRRLLAAVALVAVLLAAVDPVAAHVGGLSGSVESGPLPSWLTLGTGGALIGVSFLFTSFMTDHDRIRAVNRLGVRLPPAAAVGRAARLLARAAGLVGLALVVATAFVGPRSPLSNFAILVVWSGWWAGYTMSTYLVGNAWPVVNPWRTLAERLPAGDRAYPGRLGTWPAVAGLLGLVFVEVVGPLAEDARLLGLLVVAYSAVTLLGAAAYGTDVWFGRVDPIARVFDLYGRVAPVGRTDDGALELALPVTRLVDYRVPDRPGETAFVVALLWATTFDGLVTTPAWAGLTRAVVGAGVPPTLVYLLTMVGGFGAFLAVYRLAARRSRATADSYVAVDYIERWFVPSLLPIAVGYHLAHYLNYFLTLAPALAAAVASPFSPGHSAVLSLPSWFGIVLLGFVLAGHMLAVWVAHSLAFDLYPGVLTPIRSQYPFVVVMIAYTVTSLWIVAQPFTQPPYT